MVDKNVPNWQDDNIDDDQQVDGTVANKPTLDDFDDEKLKLAQQKRTLSKYAFVISITMVILAILLILSVVCRVIFSDPCALLQLKDLWHIYLITTVTLTTTIGILLAFNRGTWKESDKKDDDKLDTIPQAKVIMEILESSKKLFGNQT